MRDRPEIDKARKGPTSIFQPFYEEGSRLCLRICRDKEEECESWLAERYGEVGDAVTYEPFKRAILIWVGVVSRNINETPDRNIATRDRDLYCELKKNARSLSKSLDEVVLPDGKNDAGPSMRLEYRLGTEIGVIQGQIDKLAVAAERAKEEAQQHVSTSSDARQYTRSARREAIGMLAYIWRWSGKVRFGDPFKELVSSALVIPFGEKKAETGLQDDIKETIAKFNKNPEKFRLAWLSKK